MKTRDFSFNIDKDRIAQYPPENRGASRLLVLERDGQKIRDAVFPDFPLLLKPGSLLVINDSKVRKARVYGINRETGGKTEFLFLSRISPDTWKVIASRSAKQKTGKTFFFGDDVYGTISGSEPGYKIISLNRVLDDGFFEKFGHVPLPPYIRRNDEHSDESRYQTVYAGEAGSAAAPTAGLHFTDSVLSHIRNRGIELIRVTLHVGIGTFLPIRTENIEDHVMHEEEYYIPDTAASALDQALSEKRDIIAVGTTVVRTLESAFIEGKIRSGRRSTSLFIYPGYRFNVISGLFTNFHTPESSLLVMVSAFAGKDLIDAAYRHALECNYRFFSYGDAMFII